MSRLSDALRAFSKTYHEAAPVRDGACHDEADASEIDAWPMKKYGTNEIGSGGYRVLDAEGGDDSRRGAGGPGYPVDKSDPSDPMEPGWNGPASDDDEEEAHTRLRSAKVKIQCPHCGEANTVRLPKHLTLARAAYAHESEGGGKILRTKCGECGEAVRFHAPEGHAFVRRTGEALQHFFSRYRYLSGRGSNPITRGLRSAREAFKRSYYGR